MSIRTGPAQYRCKASCSRDSTITGAIQYLIAITATALASLPGGETLFGGFASAANKASVGLRDMLGPDTAAGYHGQGGYFDGIAQTVLGPTYSTMLETGRAVGGLSHVALGDGISQATNQQIRAWRRMAPFQNLFYTDFLFDALENGFQSASKRQGRAKAMLELSGHQ